MHGYRDGGSVNRHPKAPKKTITEVIDDYLKTMRDMGKPVKSVKVFPNQMKEVYAHAMFTRRRDGAMFYRDVPLEIVDDG